MLAEQVLQQLQVEDQRKEAAIKLLEKAKRIKDKQLRQAQQCADRATETLADAVRQSTHLSQLVCPFWWSFRAACQLKQSMSCSTANKLWQSRAAGCSFGLLAAV